MNLQEKRKKSANIAFALDMLHIVVGILNFANGYDRYRRGRGRKHLRTGGMILMAVGAGLFLLCIVSTLTIWWG